MKFRLRTLGNLALVDEFDRPVKLRSRKSMFLLACLASRREPNQSREWLAGVIWGNRQEEQARNSLRTALSDIRKVLGGNAISSNGNLVSLDSSLVSSDFERLRALADADPIKDPGELIDFYGGDFLADVYDGDEGSEWLEAARSEARDLASVVLEKASDYLANAGRSRAAVARARELLSLDPLSEKSHRRLMRLYADSGERSKAISQYQTCRELMKFELGVEPSEETRQLADSIAVRRVSALSDLNDILSHRLPAPDKGSSSSKPAVTERLAPNSIAVLPFVNLSGDVDQDFFAEGISEDIITDLTKVTDLSVAAASATRMYRGTTMRPREIAAELGVRYLLEGSVRRSDGILRITSNLIDGQTDRQIWGERYDRERVNVFDIQSEISASVASAVESTVSPAIVATVASRGTDSFAAHEHYLKGRALLREMRRSSVELSKASFEQAIELDRGYAMAYAGLAESITMLCWHYDGAGDLLKQAADHCQTALKLDPGLAEAHCSLGRYHSLFLRFEEAEAEFETALNISPTLQEAYLYRALMLLTTGRPDTAIGPLRRAFELGRQDLHTGMMLMNCQQALGLKTEHLETARLVLKLAKRRLDLNAYDDQAAYVGAMALCALGETATAMRWANVAASFEVEDQRSTYNVACLYANLDENDRALEYLEKTLDLGVPSTKLIWIRHHDSDWDKLRDSERFKALFEK